MATIGMDLFKFRSAVAFIFLLNILLLVGCPKSEPPSNLQYSTNPATYAVAVTITNNVPTFTGAVASFSVSPALPAGLTLNTITGVISGTPTAAAAIYQITARNSAGSTSMNLSITVTSPDDAPPDVSSTSPVPNATGVARNNTVTSTFNEDIFTATVDGTSFSLTRSSGAAAGAVTFDGATNVAIP